MPTLLHIDSSPMGNASITRALTKEFVDAWKESHPNGIVIERDLYEVQIPPVTDEWVTASYTPAPQRTPEQVELLKFSDQLCDEMAAADEWVLGVPMHNFTIPSVLSLWIGHIVRVGKCFSYENGVPKGLVKNKRIHVIVGSGGVYAEDSPIAALDFVGPYLRALFKFAGLDDIQIYNAGGTSAVRSGKVDLPTYLQPHITAVRESARAKQLV